VREGKTPEASVLEVGELLEGGRAVHAERGNHLPMKKSHLRSRFRVGLKQYAFQQKKRYSHVRYVWRLILQRLRIFYLFTHKMQG
jgi:hypothetical protein